jgi:hypothetical protein
MSFPAAQAEGLAMALTSRPAPRKVNRCKLESPKERGS